MAASTRPTKRVELTYRGILLGAVITGLFTAANVYLGLKVGLTFATSLPAAVISMAILRFFRNSTIWENNIVQTIASAAGTLSSIVFVLPGLVMIGYWTGFPFWQSFGICVMGGILGVMYSVPLRRAMVTGSDLPYPEGVAAAEVLRVGAAATRHEGADPAALAENKAGFTTIVWSSVASLAFFMIIATNVFAGEIRKYVRVGTSALTGLDIGLSLALVGVGHLVGVTVGVAMLAGIALAWVVLVPVLSSLHAGAGPDIAAMANDVFRHRVRFIGAGAIGVAAIWSLGRLAGPLVRGVIASLAASRARGTGSGDALPITERDIPFNIVIIVSAICLVPIGLLLAVFLSGGVIASAAVPLVIAALVYIVLAGILVAAVCGYMAGLIGSSNSPVSGLAILTVLGASLLLVALAHPGDATAGKALVAYALFVTAIIINIATISNDNLQDLKTGQLVGATPWRQQVALIIGVVFGSLVIPPILVVLNNAFGFQGSPMHGITAQPLAAPQATLISALAQGVITGDLPWNLIAWGAGIGLVIVAIDEILRRRGRQFPPLAVALGIYLPMSVTFMVVVGAFIGKFYNSWVSAKPNGAVAIRLGVLLASGFIVGESLGGVILSGIITAANKDAPLAQWTPDFFTTAGLWIGGVAFVLVVFGMYRWVGRLARRAV
ncbi:MAG: oligopeptide transporter, OPT family [Candidatus Eremiobacteraeota bacterium]|nr:oligopeptide transporter, OPT family [Candidatus Eremiobacteraeota bacterium]